MTNTLFVLRVAYLDPAPSLRRTRCCAVRYDGVWWVPPLLSFVLGFFFFSLPRLAFSRVDVHGRGRGGGAASVFGVLKGMVRHLNRLEIRWSPAGYRVAGDIF